ncbi:SDR family NAD(P)-dependent oxidoreductase [Tessaracoccus sp. OS52]|uniref:SDR family NAD(P)-dependent oxidoreductase n=1 Tax=Tessaracoccus sp. OS52 TaxID=2886691 RepID=UPI001D121588|nr:SDR family NAD(P)-dependent oxidoreductase [Tessaracoccus sp. OS52]MCC2594171.1 SDR family NAD(P)-dependent oxidoreductase [Tessaracoccus sp. OS52]
MATALITGATAGIGNAFGRELASRGQDLVIVARDTARLESVAGELRRAHGVEVEVLTADLSVRADVDRVAARLEDQDRPVDLLVNNAGFGLHSSLLDASEIETHIRALDVMCLAVLILGGAAGRAMKQRGRGRIINVASTSAAIFSGNYSAIKSWARTYSTALALELKDTGVTVTGLLPGWVRTEFHERAGLKANNLPNIVWIDADVLVRECLDDAEKGRIESIPTWKWKLAMFVGDHGPRALTRWFSAKLTSSRKKR